MKRTNMVVEISPADKMKAAVIDFLLNKYPKMIVGNEIMYGSRRKVVDLLALHNGETFAIEIKSDNDDLRRLPNQVKEYNKIFDYTIIFVQTKYIKEIMKMKDATFSLFSLNDKTIISIKKDTKPNTNLSKREMLSSISSVFLRKTLHLGNNINSDKLREYAMNLTHKEIHDLQYHFFKSRISDGFNLFVSQKQGKTMIDDLNLLSQRINL